MDELLTRQVRLHGIQVGIVVDVILEAVDGGAMGLEVRCEDGLHRFLPMAAATVLPDQVVIDSPFSLLDGDQLDFYRARGVALRRRRESAA